MQVVTSLLGMVKCFLLVPNVNVYAEQEVLFISNTMIDLSVMSFLLLTIGFLLILFILLCVKIIITYQSRYVIIYIINSIISKL